VRQVGYLQGLYRDARSTEHKILHTLDLFILVVFEIIKKFYLNLMFITHRHIQYARSFKYGFSKRKTLKGALQNEQQTASTILKLQIIP
jgi:hypothetical protein